MKKLLAIMMAAILAGSVLVGCTKAPESKAESAAGSTSASAAPTEDVVNVTLLGAGYGDKSFWDSAKAGAEALEATYPGKVKVKIVDMTSDTKKWPTAMFEAGDSDADLIITGGFQQVDNMQDIASQYPDKKWISFDTALNYEENEIGNVYSMGYQVNQAGYLAGMVAAELTTSEKEGINPEKIIGFVGGMENTPIIGEFLVGYIEGAKSVDPEIKIVTSYTNSFEDSAKGKEITLAQFNSDKADVVFAVAGASGTGCIEAAANEGKYVIGVDSDQSLLYEGRTEQKSIVTSALKRVDQSIINAVGRHLDGSLPYGTYEVLGLKDDCVGIVYNDIFKGVMSEESIAKIQEAEGKLKDGSVTISSAFDMTNEEVKAMADSVRP